MKVQTLGSTPIIERAIESLSAGHGSYNQGWSDIVSRIGHYIHNGIKTGLSPSGQIDQLSDLLKLQVDVTRYQLRVELVSKVSESAVASIRKLQQNQ